MRLPAYRYMIIKRDSFSQQLSAIKRYEFAENPIVFDLTLMKESSQDQILPELIQELKKLKLTQIPYQVYILSTSSLRFREFNIIKSDKELPIFHKKKEKSLNVREAALLNKIKLKQRKLSQIDAHYYDETIDRYASSQKRIKAKQNFFNFLSYIGKMK